VGPLRGRVHPGGAPMWYLIETRNEAGDLTPITLEAWRAFVEATPGMRLAEGDDHQTNPFTGEPLVRPNAGGDAEVQPRKGARYRRLFRWDPPGRVYLATFTEGPPARDPAYKLATKFARSVGGEVVEFDGNSEEEFPAPEPPPLSYDAATLRLVKATDRADAAGALKAIAAGADVRAVNREGFPPIHHWVGNPEVLRALLAAGADPNQRGPFGFRPTLWVESAESVRLLVEAGADLAARDDAGDTALHHAAKDGRLNAIDALLRAGTDIRATNGEGETPLHAAAEGGEAAFLALLRAGADIAALDEYERTPLDAAETNIRGSRPGPEWFEFRRQLVALGAVDAPSSDLVDAAHRGDVVKFLKLMSSGADLDVRADQVGRIGVTPLYAAACAGHAAIVDALLDAGVDVDAVIRSDNTMRREPPLINASALAGAASHGRADIVRVLLAAGAAPGGMIPRNQPTPLERAVDAGREEIAAMLKEALRNQEGGGPGGPLRRGGTGV
jgi:ankyrin repeat protein